MKERPILFQGAMVRAILAGTKTQTRRVVKPQPPAGWNRHCWYSAPVYGWTFQPAPTVDWHKARCPYGQPGDRLWVREAWSPNGPAPSDGALYRADFSEGPLTIKFKPSIHMPRWASRILLEITAVRVERLQQISEADAIAEGIDTERVRLYAEKGSTKPAMRAYADLWGAINGHDGPASWAANPWVWVVEFKKASA